MEIVLVSISYIIFYLYEITLKIGSISVHGLLLSPPTRALVQRAILSSGVILNRASGVVKTQIPRLYKFGRYHFKAKNVIHKLNLLLWQLKIMAILLIIAMI